MKAPSRPRLDLERSGLEMAIGVIGLLGLVMLAAVTLIAWPDLPERVPTHFGPGGEPDGWGSRWTFLLLPVVALVMFVLLTVLARYPHTYNYPVTVTPANAETQYRLARGLLVWMKMEIAWMFAGIQWGTVQVALERTQSLGGWFVFSWLAVIFGTVALYLVRALRAR